ncbi:MAG: hypothetical protein OHK0022_38170 [Roseiflexaceae bacterium]
MRRSLLPAALSLGIALLFGLIATTRAENCPEGQFCIMVPSVQRSNSPALPNAATPTPTIAVTPAGEPCSTSAPPPAEGLQAWFVPDDSQMLCTRLFVNSRPIEGLQWEIILHTAQRSVVMNVESTERGSPAASSVRFFYAENVSGEQVQSIDIVTRYLDQLYKVTLPGGYPPVLTPSPAVRPSITVASFNKSPGTSPVAAKVFVSSNQGVITGAVVTMEVDGQTFTLTDVGGGFYANCAIGSFDDNWPSPIIFTARYQGQQVSTPWFGSALGNGTCP